MCPPNCPRGIPKNFPTCPYHLLKSQLPVSLLDLLGIGTLSHAQDAVRIPQHRAGTHLHTVMRPCAPDVTWVHGLLHTAQRRVGLASGCLHNVTRYVRQATSLCVTHSRAIQTWIPLANPEASHALPDPRAAHQSHSTLSERSARTWCLRAPACGLQRLHLLDCCGGKSTKRGPSLYM